MSDPLLRQNRRRGLLKGEQLHQLARDVAYGKRERIRASDLQEQKNTCSCITLIIAYIIYWQAKEITRVIKAYGHELDKRMRWHARTFCTSWHLDETYLRVKGKWKYLYRAIDKNGVTIDFMISSMRNYQAAYRFLKNALKKVRVNERPLKITTDKHPCYAPAIQALKKEKLLNPHVEHRQMQYLNNIIESNHRRIKRRTRPMLGFKSLISARRVIEGIEAVNMIVKKQSSFFAKSIHDQIYFIHRIFNIFTRTMSKI